jgi:hypothetical protein
MASRERQKGFVSPDKGTFWFGDWTTKKLSMLNLRADGALDHILDRIRILVGDVDPIDSNQKVSDIDLTSM